MTITADLLSAPPAAPPDRRQSPRYKPAQQIATIIGRGTGALVDISATGARIRHASPVALGSRARITFEWKGERFEAVGEVLASRVAGLGNGGTQFESRMRFLPLTPHSAEVLERALNELGEGDLRKWVANLRGWNEEEEEEKENEAAPARAFIRCRLMNGRWEQRLTHDATMPLDGFTVPAGTEPSEIRALCRTFEQSDAEGRRLVQVMTSAVVKQHAR